MYIGIIIVCALVLFAYVYRNSRIRYSYGLTIIYGKKGSGKTTTLAKYATCLARRPVYSNCKISGTSELPDNFYDYAFPPGALILIDEGGLQFNSRSFTTFPKKAIRWFKLQRHLRVMVVITSQAPDMDLIIRNLADNIYISHGFGYLTTMTKYVRKIVVLRAGKNGAGQIAEDFAPHGILSRWFFILACRYWNKFDSWEVPDDFEMIAPLGAIDNPEEDKFNEEEHRRVEKKSGLLRRLCRSWHKNLRLKR